MNTKTHVQFFMAVSILIVIISLAYIVYDEPTVNTYFVGNVYETGSQTFAVSDDYWDGNVKRQWVSQPQGERYFDPYFDDFRFRSYRDFKDEIGKTVFFRSGDCKNYYDDPYHPLFGDCQETYDHDTNPHQIKRCDRICGFDFDEKFDLCEDNWEPGTREYRQCVEYYDSKEANYDAACYAECEA